MMNSMMRDPFAEFFGPPPQQQIQGPNRGQQVKSRNPRQDMMAPFGGPMNMFGGFNSMFSNMRGMMDNMEHSFVSLEFLSPMRFKFKQRFIYKNFFFIILCIDKTNVVCTCS